MTRLTTREPSRHPTPTARALALSHLVFERPDLELAQGFLSDFGLRVVERTDDALFLRAADAAPFCYVVRRGERARFLGLGLRVAGRGDLELLQAALPGPAIEPFRAPGGGLCLELRDPSGFLVQVVSAQGTSERIAVRGPLPCNTGASTPRVNATQRPPAEAPILKLGHVVIEAASFQDTCGWYTRHFGFIPSDVQVLPDGSPAVVFLRLDRGSEPTDHHTLAIAQGVGAAYGHAAFEVVDLDAIAVGQRLLRERGFRHAWGIGRHILGSQIFDYWSDPFGDKHEHYTDGDVFTADVPMGVHPVSREAMAQWGPPMPRSFTAPRLSAQLVMNVAHHLRETPDLDLKKLVTLKKIFG
ncbi:MAG: VOC family protein [Deltaproteobacteria bacterium]|nr:VOC family protein [Deltaproteobacteria bacterium]